MNIGDFLHSRKWRTIQNYTYSFGASVVLIGALAKLEHWPMASGFLMTGLGMEALIFFISAFEPLMENPDWKRVYPQLREGDELPKMIEKYATIDEEYHQSIKDRDKDSKGGGISIKDLPAEQVKKLNDSFEKLAEAANGMRKISEATLVTEGFVNNLKEASLSIKKVDESGKQVSASLENNLQEIAGSYKIAAQNILSSSESLKASGEKVSTNMAQSVAELSESIKTTATGIKGTGEKFKSDLDKSSADFGQKLQSSASELNESYRKVSESLSGGLKGIEKSSANYVDGIEKLNKNMAALNAAYEIHLKGADEVEKVVKQYSSNVSEIGKLLHSSVEETKKFNDNTKEINENIQALNKVYGRMLGALNTKK